MGEAIGEHFVVANFLLWKLLFKNKREKLN